VIGSVNHLDLLDPIEPKRTLRPEYTNPNPISSSQAGTGRKHIETLLSPVAIEGHGHRAVLRHDYSCV
jgi:hypothetical protein